MGPGKNEKQTKRQKKKKKPLYYYRSTIKTYLPQLMKMYFNERGPFEYIIAVCVCLHNILDYLDMS